MRPNYKIEICLFFILWSQSFFKSIILKNMCDSLFIQACKAGDIASVQQLYLDDITYWNHIDIGYQIACEYGHIEVVQWLYKMKYNHISNKSRSSYSIIFGDIYLLTKSCQHGHIEIAKWIYQLNPEILTNYEVHEYLTEEIFCDACKNGHLNIAKWIFEIKPYVFYCISDDGFTCSQDGFHLACINNKIEVAQWIYETDPHFYNIVINGPTYTYKKHPKNVNKFPKNSYWEELLFDVCWQGNIEMAKWIYKINPSIIRNMDTIDNNDDPNKNNTNDYNKYNQFLFINMCEKGWTNIVKWLYEINPSMDISAKRHAAFRGACTNGHMETAVWLYNLIRGNIDIYIIHSIFEGACLSGNNDMIQWLYNINPHIDIDYCIKGDGSRLKLSIAKWLYELNPVISQFHNKVFTESCIYGQFEMAQWLYQLDPVNTITAITYHSIYSKMLRFYNTNLINMLEWLFTIKPENHNWHGFDSIFHDACKYGLFDLALWMSRIKPYSYKVTVKSHQIVDYVIVPRKDRKWNQRKYLLFANQIRPPLFTNILWELPSEVCKDICVYL